MRCEACQFWVTLEPGGVPERTGHCRRYPPQVVARTYTETANEHLGRYNDEVSSTTDSEWPVTQSRDWCGEFEPA